MAKSRKVRKSGAKTAARRKVPARARSAVKAKAKPLKLRAGARPVAPKAKPVPKDLRAVAVLPKGVILAKLKPGKVAQKMDKAALKKALLDERIAKARAKKAEGKRSTRGLTAKERALVKEFERRELSPADAEARRLRLKNLIVLGKQRSYLT